MEYRKTLTCIIFNTKALIFVSELNRSHITLFDTVSYKNTNLSTKNTHSIKHESNLVATDTLL